MTQPLAIIIEDDPVIGKVYSSALETAGYETYLDPNGDQYLEKLSAPNLKVIVLDLHLPYASGTSILDQLRADERCQNVPVIVTTADLLNADTVAEKATQVLMKPVSMARLVQVVNAVCA
jgi:CheY-like chemotaxis protein